MWKRFDLHEQPRSDAARCGWSAVALALRGGAFGKLPACLLRHAAGTPTVCGYRPVPPRIAPDRRTPRAGRTSGQRRKALFCGWGRRRWQPPEQHRQGPGAWQDNSSLPPGHICRSPRRRSLMNQVEHPATGWRDPLICTRRSTSPAPCLARRSPARLTPGRQRRNKGAGGGTRQRRPPETEGGSGWRQSSFAGRHGCEECSRSPYCLGSFVLLHTHTPLPNRTGGNIGSGTETALLKEGLARKKASRPLPAVRARLARRPALLLPQRAGRVPAVPPPTAWPGPGAAERQDRRTRGRGDVSRQTRGTRQPRPAPPEGGLPSPRGWRGRQALPSCAGDQIWQHGLRPQERHGRLCQTSAALSSGGRGPHTHPVRATSAAAALQPPPSPAGLVAGPQIPLF